MNMKLMIHNAQIIISDPIINDVSHGRPVRVLIKMSALWYFHMKLIVLPFLNLYYSTFLVIEKYENFLLTLSDFFCVDIFCVYVWRQSSWNQSEIMSVLLVNNVKKKTGKIWMWTMNVNVRRFSCRKSCPATF